MDGHASSPSSSFSESSSKDSLPAEAPVSSPNSKAESVVLPPQHESPIETAADASHDLQTPETDRHPKGKRKRTAAKDKAILEAAYSANPKPDKAARLDIVQRVSLNEKEVQIWFQNRRQNDRRKSRPLSPQEIAALRYGGMQILSSDPPSYHPPQPSHATGSSGTSPVHSASFVDGPPLPPPPPHSTSPTSSQTHSHQQPPAEAESQGHVSDQEERTRPETKDSPVTSSHTPSPQTADGAGSPYHLSRSFLGRVGYLANRWNAGSSFSTPSSFSLKGPDDSFSLEPFPPSSCSSNASALVLPPPKQSQVRLSLSLDGKAELKNPFNSPSPPRNPPTRFFEAAGGSSIPPPLPPPLHHRRSFHRSHSALPSITLPPISALTGSLSSGAGPASSGSARLPPRLGRGRSRDVHVWESCAADAVAAGGAAEDELTAQARNESSGSAIAAISLLRSASGLSTPPSSLAAAAPSYVLQPNASKRNTPTGGNRAAAGRGGKRPKLGRASSSIGRLQTSFGGAAAGEKPVVHQQIGEADSNPEKVKVSILISPSGNDSDKENWGPDEDGNPHMETHRAFATGGGRRRLPSGASGPKAAAGLSNPRRTTARALDDHRRGFFAGSRANTAPVMLHQAVRKGGGAKAAAAAQLEIFEDDEDQQDDTTAPGARWGSGRDDEVERFARGEVSPGKKGDMDCVAGLLSLSQGNWR